VGVGPGLVGSIRVGHGILDECSATGSELLEVHDVGDGAYLSVDGEAALEAYAWAELSGGAGIGCGEVDDQVGLEESGWCGEAEGELVDGVGVCG
jgi:hypothetical protein